MMVAVKVWLWAICMSVRILNWKTSRSVSFVCVICAWCCRVCIISHFPAKSVIRGAQLRATRPGPLPGSRAVIAAHSMRQDGVSGRTKQRANFGDVCDVVVGKVSVISK